MDREIYIAKDTIIIDDHLRDVLKVNGYKIIEHFNKNNQEVIKIELKNKIPDKLRKALGGVVQAMAASVELRDPYTAGHQMRVADIARRIATEMGIGKGDEDGILEGIRVAATIHDIGKLGIPSDLLSKPTENGLSDTEFELIKEHPRKGYEILKEIDFPWPIAEIVYQHHERVNGSGYPRKLKGKKILLEARIIAVADVVEAMASHRPYRPALGIEKAIEEIYNNKGKLYDKKAVAACLALYARGELDLT